MRLNDITAPTIKSISTKELVNLHYRIHQLYGGSENRDSSSGYMKMLEEKHSILANEMIRRGFKHETPLTRDEKIKSFIKI